MTEWQPIETAPMNGNFFLGAKKLGPNFGWHRYICCWHPITSKFAACFSVAEGGQLYPLNDKNTPSHWMPLPEPPK